MYVCICMVTHLFKAIRVHTSTQVTHTLLCEILCKQVLLSLYSVLREYHSERRIGRKNGVRERDTRGGRRGERMEGGRVGGAVYTYP